MKIKVLAIAPYPGLKDLLKDIAKEDVRFEIDIEIADLQNALPIIKGAKGQPYDVIISRGGTASFIREHVSTPVVDVPVSGYDILRVLTLVKHSNSKFAIIGFPNICQGAEVVSSLLDMEIPIYTINKKTDVKVALQEAFNIGVNMILGDVVTVRIAEELGYNGILITSGRESVKEALSEAKRSFEIVLKAKENERFYKHILENHRTGVLAADSRGVIRYANLAASELLGYDKMDMKGMNLIGIAPEWERYLEEAAKNDVSPLRKKIKSSQDRQMNIDIVVPTDTQAPGYLIYMYPVEGNAEKNTYSAFEVTERIAGFAQIIGSSHIIQQTTTRAKMLAQSDKPIWISGERGSGKHLFTQAIHSASECKRNGLYVLPCDSLSETELESILFGNSFELGLLNLESVGTIYLKQIQHFSSSFQQKLITAIQAEACARIIISSLIPIKNLLKMGQINKEFAELFVKSNLQMPPLRDRLEDIEEITRVQIAAYNSQYGKQIVAIRPEVLEDLIQRQWPGNINQLKYVVKAMLLSTTDHYIGAKEAEEGWRKVKSIIQIESTAPHSVLLNLSGNWEDIEQRVLSKILQEEGMNQSKAAKRLGITRSTLWRKIKKMY
jgi:propionate catabolism operon transcriptional regulator